MFKATILRKYDGFLGLGAMKDFLGEMQNDRDFCVRVLDFFDADLLARRMVSYEAKVFFKMLKRHYHISELPEETKMEVKYHLRASSEIVFDWIRNQNDVSRESLAQRLLSFMPQYLQEMILEHEAAQTQPQLKREG